MRESGRKRTPSPVGEKIKQLDDLGKEFERIAQDLQAASDDLLPSALHETRIALQAAKKGGA
jgi:hypothetical protein